MLNAEKYKKEIEKLGCNFAIVRGKLCVCPANRCFDNCEFGLKSIICNEPRMKWLLSEYVEPQVGWPKVAVDTNILTSEDGESWHKAHFAKFENGKIYAWNDYRTSWTSYLPVAWKYAKLAEEEQK